MPISCQSIEKLMGTLLPDAVLSRSHGPERAGAGRVLLVLLAKIFVPRGSFGDALCYAHNRENRA